MNENLHRLYEELKMVQNSPEEFLPAYGYSSKSEIIELIQIDISSIEESRIVPHFDYTNEELEDERSYLCQSQGISRYC